MRAENRGPAVPELAEYCLINEKQKREVHQHALGAKLEGGAQQVQSRNQVLRRLIKLGASDCGQFDTGVSHALGEASEVGGKASSQ